MKKILLCLLALQSLYLHAQWRTVYQGSDTTNNIASSSFISPSSGYVASRKWIGYTTDSGHTFQRSYITYSNVNYGLHSVNLLFGFDPADVKAINSTTLLVSGDYGFEPSILYSSDAGLSWTLVYHKNLPLDNPLATNAVFQMVFPANGTTGYAVQGNEILKTTNGGLTWQTIYTTPGQGLFTLSFSSATTGFVAGPNLLLKTTDGGASWSPITGPFVIRTMAALSDQKVFVTTALGDTYYSTDAGATWNQSNTATGRLPNNVSQLHFVNDTTGYISAGVVYQTRNRGKSWEMMPGSLSPREFFGGYNKMFFLTDQQAWVAGSGETLLLSANGGGVSYPRALFDVNTSDVCAHGTVQLLNQSQPGYTYTWYRNRTVFSNSYNASYTTTTSGIDTILLVVNNGILSDSSTQIVNTTVASSVSLNSHPRRDSACSGSVLLFDIFNSRPDVSYQVSRPCCNTTGYFAGNGGTLTISYYLNPGEDSSSTFTVSAYTSNDCGRQEAKQDFRVAIVLSDPPTTTLTDTICPQKTFYIRIPNSRNNYLYSADPAFSPVRGTGDTISIPCTIGRASSSSAIDPNGLLVTYHFPVYVSHITQGCTAMVADAVMIGRNAQSIFDLNGYEYFSGDALQLVNTSKNATSWLWRFPDGGSPVTSPLSAPPASYTTGGYKSIMLIAYTREGCADSTTRTIQIFQQDAAVPSTPICPSGGAGNVVDSMRAQQYFVDRSIYEDEYGNRIVAGGYTDMTYPYSFYPRGFEGWYATKFNKSGQVIWSLRGLPGDERNTYRNWAHLIVEHAVGDSLGNTYLMGHCYSRLYVTAIGENKYPVPNTADFLMKVSPAGHIVWEKNFTSVDWITPSYTYDFFAGGTLLRGRGNTVYVVTQRYPGSIFMAGNTTVFNNGEGNEGVIMQFDGDGNLLRKSSFQCPVFNLVQTGLTTWDNYNQTPPAIWAGGRLVVYSGLYPSQSAVDGVSVGFSSAQIQSALITFDTATLHAVSVRPVFANEGGAASGITADAFTVDSAGNYYASYSKLVPGANNKPKSYIEAFDATGNLRWVKEADGLQPRNMAVFPGQLKVCGTNYILSGFDDIGMKMPANQSPSYPWVKKLTVVGDTGTSSGRGGYGLGSLDIIVASLRTNDGQLIDWLPLGSSLEDDNMIMRKGYGDQLWIAGTVGNNIRNVININDTSSALYLYKIPVSNDCTTNYAEQPAYLKWDPSSDSISCTDSLYTLTWSSYATGSLDVLFSIDSGAHYNSLATSLAPTGNGYTFNVSRTGAVGKIYFIIKDAGSSLADTTVRNLLLTAVPTVRITTPDSVTCKGVQVLFTTTVTNGGSVPAFQWLINQGLYTGYSADTLQLNWLRDKDQVQVRLISNAACAGPSSVTSNSITMSVAEVTTPAVSISGADTVKQGHMDTVIAHPVQAGSSPTYKWQDSTAQHSWAAIAGAADTLIYYTPAASGDKLRCIVISHDRCASPDSAVSNIIAISVTPVVTGINTPTNSDGSVIHLYPNPTGSLITVDTLLLDDKWESLNIVDLNGREVLPEQVITDQRRVTLDVRGLPAGLYFIRINGRRKTAYLRFIKL